MQGKEKRTKKVVEELKICIRKLPPNLSQDVFLKSIVNYKDTIARFYYVQGKNKSDSERLNLNSVERNMQNSGRAYITFNTQQDKSSFLKDYKPLFIDEKGMFKLYINTEFQRKSLFSKS